MKSHWQIHISLPCNTFTRRPGRPWNLSLLSLFLYLLSLSIEFTWYDRYISVYNSAFVLYVPLHIPVNVIEVLSSRTFIVTNLTVNSNIIIALHSLTVNNYNSSAHLYEIFNYSKCLTHHMYRYIVSSLYM